MLRGPLALTLAALVGCVPPPETPEERTAREDAEFQRIFEACQAEAPLPTGEQLTDGSLNAAQIEEMNAANRRCTQARLANAAS